MKLIMMKGLPASGKDTLANEMIANSKGKLKRVCKDDLRNMLDNGAWSKHREKEIITIRDVVIEDLLNKGYDVISTDTNLHIKHESRLRGLASDTGAKFEIIDLTNVSLTECIHRDAGRGLKSVGKEVITSMYYQFIFKKENWTIPLSSEKPKIVICDIDGTLAIHNERSNPYDSSKYNEDLFNYRLWELIKGKKVIFFSGREATVQGYKSTVDWLNIYTELSFNYIRDNLYMRKEGDHRRDVIVKKELYYTFIKDAYEVIAVFDDRQQVVNFWREEGIFCNQVNYGEF